MDAMQKQPLFIAGSGRSGTTWVLDVLAEANNLRTVFEPLNPDGIKEALPFANRYIKEDAQEPELQNFFEQAFNGELNSIWPNTRFLPDRLQPSIRNLVTSWDYCYMFLVRYHRFAKRYGMYLKKRKRRPIIKCIRANLMLDWIEATFDARIVFVVRHPGAVVASKIAASRKKGGEVWDFEGPNEQRILSLYQNDVQLQEDYLNRYYDIFSEKLTPVAGHTLLWCIENILPMYNQQKKGNSVFFYEDIVMDPEKEFRRMANILQLDREPDGKIIQTPSQQASVEMEGNQCYLDQLSRWMQSFTKKQCNEIERVLQFFNCDLYTITEPMPIVRHQPSL